MSVSVIGQFSVSLDHKTISQSLEIQLKKMGYEVAEGGIDPSLSDPPPRALPFPVLLDDKQGVGRGHVIDDQLLLQDRSFCLLL